jgi:hypothetical protein
VVFESEQDFAWTTIDNRYRLFNNAWNRGASSRRHRQKIFVMDDQGKTLFGWAWKWRDSSGVATYPEVLVGASPWHGEVAPDSGFPFLAGTKKLVVDYDITLAASGSYNLAFEFWVTTGLPPRSEREIGGPLSVVSELGTRVLLLPPRAGRPLYDGSPEGLLEQQELLVTSGLAHRHQHQHGGAAHAHFHVHDGD